MKEIINKADAIEAVRMSEHRITIADEQGGVGTVKWDMYGVYTAEAVEAIKALPSADAVQGEWIMHIDDLFPEESTQECSNCHEHETIFVRHSNYCPNCGAKMKDGESE